MKKILVVDDEHAICQAFSRYLSRQGFQPLIAANGPEALARARHDLPQVVFLDVRLPGMDGLAVLRALRTEFPGLPVIVMTAYGTVETALEAVRLGAFDYLGKPLDLARLGDLLERALRYAQTDGSAVLPAAAQEDAPDWAQPSLIGQTPAMQHIYKLMALLTDNDFTVLIQGESGVGKELVAQGIHRLGSRGEHPFVAVNCAAIPESLLESELFGHERGAFTGATDARPGKLESAGRGTLLLDEIGELPLLLQSKLLRVVQERRFERVGGNRPIPLAARLLAATNRDLQQQVATGAFREDLFHRLNTVSLNIPPLRQRTADIPMLARRFLDQAARRLGRRTLDLTPEALAHLQGYPWPGNVRELENVLSRSALLATGSLLSAREMVFSSQEDAPGAPSPKPGDSDDEERLRAAVRGLCRRRIATSDPSPELFRDLVTLVEFELVATALDIGDGNQVTAARLLGIHRSTLRSKLAS